MQINENWEPLASPYEQYSISDFGNLKGPRGKLIKQQISNGGYCVATIWNHCNPKHVQVHRLVAKHFCKGYRPGLIVNHKNENKQDNRASNLEWATKKKNSSWGTIKERIAAANSKPIVQLDSNNQVVKLWSSAAEAGRNGFSATMITKCCNGTKRSHKGYRWEHANKHILED